ncbi:DUF2889 domain-containing protein [Oceanibacterium hippocampi]|uniref:DUF2889 domain-containing protein n=1 Tax=Oceanibacterium hippocampi TaxID=745714 RepID=A0A1Y5THY5_9PROT|nr:DUF2889 domain-containing protein [Oceanibacterium hippocampi]SLN64582.1 hypothetical protein OCH7691_02928 [Oceanibacterium hippocampi]
MSLSEPVSRRPSHQRTIVYRSFEREDGLWDIEGELRDEKASPFQDRERGLMAPGEPVHNMLARVTIDKEMKIHEVEIGMDAVPFAFCGAAGAGAQGLIGARLGRDWRRTLQLNLGGTRGCTHLKEMLFGIATVAFQTFPVQWDAPQTGDGEPAPKKPFFLDGCHSWALDSPVVKRHFPQYYTGDDDRPEDAG